MVPGGGIIGFRHILEGMTRLWDEEWGLARVLREYLITSNGIRREFSQVHGGKGE